MKKLPRISNAEWRVMMQLWHKSPLKANEIVARLSATPWSPKTIKTLISRLVNKGAIGYRPVGRAYLYHPLVSKNACQKAASKSFLQRVYDGATKPMLAAFIKAEDLSSEEIKELKQILETKRKG